MRNFILFLSLSTLTFAQTIELESISIQNSPIDIGSYTIDKEVAQNSRSITLEDSLQRDISYTTSIDDKGDAIISFRGLNYKNITYVEDGIPVYQSVGGANTPDLSTFDKELHINDGSGVSSLGVSSGAGEISINSQVPRKKLEINFASSISNNDEFLHAYVSEMRDNIYVQTNFNYYNTKDYKLSDDYKSTPIQGDKTRLNSDKKEKNLSIKSGIFLGDNLHLAVKLNTTQSKYGLAPNVYTSLEEPVWNAYSRIDEKGLNTMSFYLDYTMDDVELSARAYYNDYSDIFAIYDDITYETTWPLVTYDDSRLGTIFKADKESDEHKQTLIFQAEENEHIRRGGDLETALYKAHTFKLSYLHVWNMSQSLKFEGGISYTLVEEKKSSDAGAMNPAEDKKTLDAQLKVVYKNNSYVGIAKKSRMPTMTEMFTFFPWENANSNLKPEKSMQYTSGHRHFLGASTDIDFSLYYYDIEDLILYRDNGHINRGGAEHYGTEIRLSSEYFEKHKLGFSYAYAHARDSAYEFLDLVPEHQVVLEDSYKLSSAWSAYYAYRYIGSRYSANSATYTDEQKKLAHYNLVEAQIAYKVKKSLKLRAGVKNILDENYEYNYGYPSWGRSCYLSLEWKL